MPYNINLTLDGKPQPKTDLQGWKLRKVIQHFTDIHKNYPQKQGYDLTIGWAGSIHPPAQRQPILDTLANRDVNQLISLFYHQDEFKDFISQKHRVDRGMHGFREYFLQGVDGADGVIHYPADLDVIHVSQDAVNRDNDFKEWFVMWYEPFDSETLEEIEAAIYRIYLSDWFYWPTYLKWSPYPLANDLLK